MKRSKFFRVATEGATTDGRKINRDWIIQAAKNFNLQKYSPRVWLEHIRGIDPNSLFKCYGDVIAVKAEAVEEGKMALFAQIQPTDALLELNKARQKLYTSIEINPSFADTGEAYLVGLGVTDSPASLGTEMLQFAATNHVLNNRKQSADNIFSEGIEVCLEFEEVEDKKTIVEHVKQLFHAFRREAEDKQDQAHQQHTADFLAAAEPIIQAMVALENKYQVCESDITVIKASMEELKKAFNDLHQKLSVEDIAYQQHRPTATGATPLMAEC